MEPFEAAGWLSLLPPIIAITLALLTKEVISSLFLGILSGTIIHTIGTGTGPLLVKPVETAFAVMVSKLDFNIILFCTLLGALVYVIAMAGGTRAYGKWATRHIKSRRSAMLSTSGLGVFIFIDDYFNCLTVGTVMRPVTDSFRISRAKLAYIIDATAAPICIIAPISSWAAAVGSNLKATGAFESDFAAFVSTIPLQFLRPPLPGHGRHGLHGPLRLRPHAQGRGAGPQGRRGRERRRERRIPPPSPK